MHKLLLRIAQEAEPSTFLLNVLDAPILMRKEDIIRSIQAQDDSGGSFKCDSDPRLTMTKSTCLERLQKVFDFATKSRPGPGGGGGGVPCPREQGLPPDAERQGVEGRYTYHGLLSVFDVYHEKTERERSKRRHDVRFV